MEQDRLQLFDKNSADSILSMNDEELQDFMLSRWEQAKKIEYGETGLYFALSHGLEHFKKSFAEEMEYDREKVLITLINDLCFEGEPLNLSFRSASAFLDSAESCDVKTSESIYPKVYEDSEAAYYLKYFHLLEPAHLELIVNRLSLPSEHSAEDDAEQIAAITQMKNICLNRSELKPVFIYDD